MVSILSSSNRSELEDEIENHLRRGWVIQGGVSTCVKQSGDIVSSVLLIEEGAL